MPWWKYVANRFLTLFENTLLGAKLSEYHTGYRAFSRTVLQELPLLENSDDFVFDNQMLAQCVMFGFRMGEVSCPTKYSRKLLPSISGAAWQYGLGVVLTSVQFRLQKLGLAHFGIFNRKGRCLGPGLDAPYYSPGMSETTKRRPVRRLNVAERTRIARRDVRVGFQGGACAGWRCCRSPCSPS